jgi:DNA/RNA endonuclease G (NUC1)
MKRLSLISILILIITPIYANDTPNIHRTKLFTYGGLPVAKNVRSDFKILVNTGYAVGYSEELKNPLWAVYRLGNKKTESIQEWERPWTFYIDIRTDLKVTHDDRLESGVTIPDEFYKIIAFKKGYLSTLKAVSFIFSQAPETNDFYNPHRYGFKNSPGLSLLVNV